LDNSTFRQKLALGSGFFCLLFLDKACDALAIPFYQMTLGVDPFLFSIALTIPIVLSAFLAPWVGQLSDNSTSRFGRRRPFIFVAAWLSAIFFGLMWMVPDHWTTNAQLLYFFIISLLFHTTVTFYTVPLTSLSYEITLDANKRIKVMEINTYFIKLASLSVQWLFPLASLAIFSSVFIGVKVVGWFIAIIVIGLIGMLPAIFVKEEISEHDKAPDKKASIVENIKVISKVPLMKLVFALVFVQVGLAAFAAKMDFYVLVYYMFDGDVAEGAIWKGVLSVGYAATAAIYIPIVSWLSRKFGKFTVLKFIFTLTMIGGMGKWFIYTPGVQWLLLLDPIFCAGIWTSMSIIVPALVADASDQFREDKKINRGGGFAAMFHWFIAVSVIFSLLLRGMTLRAIGFDASLGSDQPSDSLQIMKMILSLGTVIPSLAAVVILSRYQKSSQLIN
jgi:GPH family glycoside/pentoside/hexuronide:cation symporter